MVPYYGVFLEKDGVLSLLSAERLFPDGLIGLLGRSRGWIFLLACQLHYYYHYASSPLLSRGLYHITLLPYPNPALKNIQSSHKSLFDVWVE